MIQQCCALFIYLFFSFNWLVFLRQEGYVFKKKVLFSAGRQKLTSTPPPVFLCTSPFQYTLYTSSRLSPVLFLFFLLPLVSFIFADASSNPHSVTPSSRRPHQSVKACKIIQAECFAILLHVPPPLFPFPQFLKWMNTYTQISFEAEAEFYNSSVVIAKHDSKAHKQQSRCVPAMVYVPNHVK